jgi:hypothetical protein
MPLVLHLPQQTGQLAQLYRQAFAKAVELLIVTAFLTDWDEALQLNSQCRHFRFVIGKDSGITRKAACRKVIKWLAPSYRAHFLVADSISGFHPKAIFRK